MAGKEETPKCRKKTVTWTNEIIEDLIDFIEIHPIGYTRSKHLNSRNLNGDLDVKLVSCIPGLMLCV
jgi:hypothetical protein